MKSYFIGVDGGATKTLVRIEDEDGSLVGVKAGPSANIRISVQQSWEAITATIHHILSPLDISMNDHLIHIGMGLAGCEISDAYQAFLNTPHPFKTIRVTTDAHTACLGAHGGKDGAIIIAGTGVVGYHIQDNQTTRVGGWGFPQDDEGGGAWLGLHAVKRTLQWLDGRRPFSYLANAILTYFNGDKEELVTWANHANSTAFAQLAPFVINASAEGDPTAIELLKKAAQRLDLIHETLLSAQTLQTIPLPLTLIGGISNHLIPYLSESLKIRMAPLQFSPEQGAITYVKQLLSASMSLDGKRI